MTSYFKLQSVASRKNPQFLRECIAFAALTIFAYLIVSLGGASASYVALMAIFIAQFFFLYFLLFASSFLAVASATTFVMIVFTVGSYPVSWSVLCVLLFSLQFLTIRRSSKYFDVFLGDFFSLLATPIILCAALIFFNNSVFPQFTFKVNQFGEVINFKLIILLLASTQAILFFSVLIRIEFTRTLLEKLGPFRQKTSTGIFETQVAIGLFFGSMCFTLIIFWNTQASVSSVVSFVRETAESDNQFLVEYVQQQAGQQIALAAILAERAEESEFSEETGLEVAKFFPGLVYASYGSSIQSSRLIYRDKNVRDPLNRWKIGTFFSGIALGREAAFGENHVVVRHDVGNQQYLFTGIDLAQGMPGAPISWGLVEAGTKKIAFLSKQAVELNHTVFLTKTKEILSRHEVSFLEQAANGEVGITVERPLTNFSTINVVTFHSMKSKIDDIRFSLYLQQALFWSICLVFVFVGWRARQKVNSWQDRQLKTIAGWIPSSHDPIDTQPDARKETAANAEGFGDTPNKEIETIKRKVAEVRSIYSEHTELLAMIDAVEDNQMILVISEKGEVVFANRFAKMACNIIDGQALKSDDKNDTEMIDGSLRSAIYKTFDKARIQNRSILVERCVEQEKNGSRKNYLLGAYPYLSSREDSSVDEKRFFMSLINIDNYIANRKLAEHASRLGLLGETVAGVAHEINQPLNTIKLATANAEILLEDAEKNRELIRRKLERISAQVMRASSLINTMKNHGKIAQNEISRVNLKKCIEQAIHLYSSQLGLDNISVVCSIPDEIAAVNASELVIEQVIGNLLMNARDAIVDNSSRLKTETINIDVGITKSPEFIEVIVKNRGPAIPVEIQDRIFNPFFSTKPPGHDSGVGLGLSVSSRMMEEIGGKIKLVSSKQETIFSLRFVRSAGPVDIIS